MSFYNYTSGILERVTITGIATEDGTSIDFTDSTKDFEIDCLAGRIAKIKINDNDYYRTVSSNTVNTITLATPINPGFPAIATVGAGTWNEDTQTGEGQIVISCVEIGVVDYAVEFVAGVGESAEMSATFNENTGILTITSATNSDTTPEPIMPGNVETLINTDPELSLLFQVGNFIAGVPIPLSVEPVPFVGGEDTVLILEGSSYSII